MLRKGALPIILPANLLAVLPLSIADNPINRGLLHLLQGTEQGIRAALLRWWISRGTSSVKLVRAK